MDELSCALAGLEVKGSNGQRGRRKIISFCLYGKKEIYNVGAVHNAWLARELYPGWEVIFYVGQDSVEHSVKEALVAAGVEIRVFDENFARGYAPLLLRYLPAVEENIEIIIFRDADSRLNRREVAAVKEWLDSGFKFHLMHEAMHSPSHDREFSILGGMWGVRLLPGDFAPLPSLADDIRIFLHHYKQLANSPEAPVLPYGADMEFLKNTILPHLNQYNTLYHLATFSTSHQYANATSIRPRNFPQTQYRGFVGQPINCVHKCNWQHFLHAGCPHVQAVSYLTPELSTALRHAPNILENVAAFL